MAEYIVMPKLGFDMREGVLVGWLKRLATAVAKGDIVAEIESDKATLELESQVSGVLLHTLEEAGAVVPIGANVAIVGEAGEDISSLIGGGEAVAAPGSRRARRRRPAGRDARRRPGAGGQRAAGGRQQRIPRRRPGDARRAAHCRRARDRSAAGCRQRSRRARPQGGCGGLHRRANAGPAPRRPPAAPAPAAAAAAPVVASAADEVVATTRLRQAIGRRMTESKTTVPHFYVTSDIDMEAALALRKQINAMLEADGVKVSVNDLIVKAVALALRDFPNLNAAFNGDSIVRHAAINVGSAVAVPGGLLTVVQKQTDKSTPLDHCCRQPGDDRSGARGPDQTGGR